jgi:hypothetical protein
MTMKQYDNEEAASTAACDFECENPARIDKAWESTLPLRAADL